jgi:phage-related minor tail protein
MSDKLEKLREIMKVANDGLTRKEFEDNFSIIVDLIKQLKTNHQETHTTLNSKYDQITESITNKLKDTELYKEIVGSIKADSVFDITDLKQKAVDFYTAELEKVLTTHKGLLGEIETRVAKIKKEVSPDINKISLQAADTAHKTLFPKLFTSIKNTLSKMGAQIATALESLPEEEKLEMKAVKGLVKRLDELEKKSQRMIFGGGGVGAHNMNVYDLSSQLDGSTKVFNLPAMWKVLFVLTGGSTPTAMRPDVDFTWVPNTITFTSQIDASTTLSSGQTILIVYAE